MRWITKVRTALPGRRRAAAMRVEPDAEDLMRVWGDLAYQVAADLSWREDIGMLHAIDQGHWMRVTLEIGRRTNRHTAPPVLHPH